jgi:hypothetical protein
MDTKMWYAELDTETVVIRQGFVSVNVGTELRKINIKY